MRAGTRPSVWHGRALTLAARTVIHCELPCRQELLWVLHADDDGNGAAHIARVATEDTLPQPEEVARCRANLSPAVL